MHTVDLGGIRLHVVPVFPGLPGEGDRVRRELARLDPAVILADADAQDSRRLLRALREDAPYEPRYVDQLFSETVAARFGDAAAKPEHPFVAAARVAPRHKATFAVIRSETPPIGLFARRRARRAAASLQAPDATSLARAFADTLAQAQAWSADDDARASLERIQRLASEGRAPVVLLAQAHRADALLRALGSLRRIPA